MKSGGVHFIKNMNKLLMVDILHQIITIDENYQAIKDVIGG